MTRLEQALRWAANRDDECSIPARHFWELQKAGYLMPEDNEGYVTIRAQPESPQPDEH